MYSIVLDACDVVADCDSENAKPLRLAILALCACKPDFGSK